ncbi:thioredoxin [Sphaerotilus hippei]|uniref:Thioredoxin n=1 Tax=Sphaerotilus hippei TaxID=744406 RepID=A0A318GZP1_9BURK|nr:thioredoxin family protein [Sphaerotilus hippei]PXW95754.1 thioredoxin [Sphaerotilus hippei]
MPDAENAAVAADPRPRLVACLCAGWCTACQAYRQTFADLARTETDTRFVWIDIEAHADALGDAALEIENFPTVMLLQHGRVEFFGTILPHAGTLARMLVAARSGHLARGGQDEVAALLAPAVQRLADRLRPEA